MNLSIRNSLDSGSGKEIPSSELKVGQMEDGDGLHGKILCLLGLQNEKAEWNSLYEKQYSDVFSLDDSPFVPSIVCYSIKIGWGRCKRNFERRRGGIESEDFYIGLRRLDGLSPFHEVIDRISEEL